MIKQRKGVQRVDVDLGFLDEGARSFNTDRLCAACEEGRKREMSLYPPQEAVVYIRSMMHLRVFKEWSGRRHEIWWGSCLGCNKVDLVVCSDETWREVPL